MKEDGEAGMDIFCPDQDACVLNEAKDIQGINSGGSSNDNMEVNKL